MCVACVAFVELKVKSQYVNGEPVRPDKYRVLNDGEVLLRVAPDSLQPDKGTIPFFH